MRPIDNPNITLASADCWRFTVRSDLQNQTSYYYAETKEGGIKYISNSISPFSGELCVDYLGNVGADRIIYIRPPIGVNV